MKKLALTIALFGVVLGGCQHRYWTMISMTDGEPVTVAETTPEPEIKQPEPVPEPEIKEPEPEVESPTPKQIIYILGVDGVDWGQWATGVMDALLSLDGALDARTDIAAAEVYILMETGKALNEKEVGRLIQDDYGYGFRFMKVAEEDATWEEIGKG